MMVGDEYVLPNRLGVLGLLTRVFNRYMIIEDGQKVG